jgi:centrin-2
MFSSESRLDTSN